MTDKHTPTHAHIKAFQRPNEVGTNYWRFALCSGDVNAVHSDNLCGYCGEPHARKIELAYNHFHAMRDMLERCLDHLDGCSHGGTGDLYDDLDALLEQVRDKTKGGDDV